MNDLKGLRAVVAGAGAVGSVVALQLARQGAQVLLADPAAVGDNASGVAAGMLAPLTEALLDPAAADHYALMRQARDAWPALETSLLASPLLDRSGALVQTADPKALIAQASGRSLTAELAAQGDWLFTPEDWRLEPRTVLTALHRAFEQVGGQVIRASITGFKDGRVSLGSITPWAADTVVLATGFAAPAWTGAEAQLHPIKGQILRFNGHGPASGPVIRYRGVYLAPSPEGLVVGATMEDGRADLAIDPDAVAWLRATAAELRPALVDAPFTASAGVRAATADGLPLVGPGRQPGVVLARGARRNGWLLAPLIAEVIADGLACRPLSAAAKAFDPARFT